MRQSGSSTPNRPPPSRPPAITISNSSRNPSSDDISSTAVSEPDALALLNSLGNTVHFLGEAAMPTSMHSPTNTDVSTVQGVLRNHIDEGGASGAFRAPSFDGITGSSSRKLQTKYETEKMRREQLEKQVAQLQDQVEAAQGQIGNMQNILDENIAARIHLRTRMADKIEEVTAKYAREIKRNKKLLFLLTEAQLAVPDDDDDDDDYYLDDELVEAREQTEMPDDTAANFVTVKSGGGRGQVRSAETIKEMRTSLIHQRKNISDESFFTVPDPKDALKEEQESQESSGEKAEEPWDDMPTRQRAPTGARGLLGAKFSDDEDDEDDADEQKEEKSEEEAKEEAAKEEAKPTQLQSIAHEPKEEAKEVQEPLDASVEIEKVLGKWSSEYGLERTHLNYLMEELNDTWNDLEPDSRQEYVQEMEKQIINGKFFLIKPIAKGGFGEVFLAEVRPSKECIAVKVIDLEESDDDIMTISNEIALMRGKSCPQLINYVGSEVHYTKLWIAMEYVNGGAADTMAQMKPRRLTEKHIAIIAREVVLGLRYLNTQSGGSFIHRDIKGANILLGTDGQVKLADFGASKSLEETVSQAQTFVGSPYWMAPEVMNGKYDNKADIWGIGITCMELANGLPPRSDVSPLKVMDIIYNGPPPRLEGKKWSQNFKDFVSECLVKDPQKRPGLRDLLRSPFIKKALSNTKLAELFDGK